jgi:hypothetical protein
MVTAQRTAKNTATLNIEAMLEREAERQDDLREAESKRISGILEAKAEYLEQMRKADKEAIALARTSDREAIAIAREDVDRRLEEMNLMRQQIASERGSFIRTDWFESKHKEVEVRLTKLEEWQWKVVGGMAVVLLIGSIFGWVVNTIFFHH